MYTKIIFLFSLLLFSFHLSNAQVNLIETQEYSRLVFNKKSNAEKRVFYVGDKILFKEIGGGKTRIGTLIKFSENYLSIKVGDGKLYDYFFGAKTITLRYEDLKSIANRENNSFWFFTKWRGVLMFILTIATIGYNVLVLLGMLISMLSDTVYNPFEKWDMVLE